MKRLLLLGAAALSMAAVCVAQDIRTTNFLWAVHILRVHASGTELTQLVNLPAVQYQPHNINLNLYGWEGTLIENVRPWFGGEVDAGGFYGTPNATFLYPASQFVSPSPNFSTPVPVITREQTVLFGPRFSLRKRGMAFVVHVPAGVANVHTGLNEPAVVAANFVNLRTGTLKSSTGFAISPGVGVDVRVNSRIAIRAIQIDYLMTHAFGERQDNFRLSSGVNFTFGEW